MMEEKLAFSINSKKKAKLKEFREACRLAEKYFKVSEDPEQMPADHDSSIWLSKNFPESLNTITLNGKLIGYTFILVCSREDMLDFVSKKINERQLWVRVKKNFDRHNFNAMYVCTVIITPKYRRRGIALMALKEHIARITAFTRKDVRIFYWAWSKEGEKLAQAIKNILKIPIYFRK
jgi:hypothetical protein